MTQQTGASSTDDLLGELKRIIRDDGPIPVARYMELCLSHPEFGYYRGAEAIGATGDFVTAPEISQIFGELIGIWVAATWQQMGQPASLRLVELGPGRGTMMRDALRAVGVVPGLRERLVVSLVEISPRLRSVQKATLSAANVEMTWLDTLSDLDLASSATPTLLIANEFFDALPITQHVQVGDEWQGRTVTLDAADTLCFAPAGNTIRESRLSALTGPLPAFQAAIARIAQHAPTALLAIDYGYEGPATGDTLQAMRQQAYADVLHAPGSQDLTAHVDFTELAEVLRKTGLRAHPPISQVEFLSGLGLGPRLDRLLQGKSARDANAIETAAHRLVAEPGMGEHFRVLGARTPDIPDLIPFPPAT